MRIQVVTDIVIRRIATPLLTGSPRVQIASREKGEFINTADQGKGKALKRAKGKFQNGINDNHSHYKANRPIQMLVEGVKVVIISRSASIHRQ
jgi:hypothetical protein